MPSDGLRGYFRGGTIHVNYFRDRVRLRASRGVRWLLTGHFCGDFSVRRVRERGQPVYSFSILSRLQVAVEVHVVWIVECPSCSLTSNSRLA